MRVLEIINSLKPIGGGETFATNISRSFAKICDLKVVILRQPASQMFVDRLDERKIDYVFLNRKKHIDFNNAKQIAKIINDFKPDYIHTENNALIPVYLSMKYVPKKSRPYVFHTMHLAPEDECSKRLVRMMYRHIFKKKKFIPVAITESLSHESENFYRLKEIPFVENGIDLDRFTKFIPLKERKYDVTVLARFTYQKNHEFLIKTLCEVRKRVKNLKVAFVGGGELLDQMKDLAHSMSAEFIEFTGVMSNTSSILEQSKIIALGSRFEANPLSLLEGMAAGCVVVSSDVGGIRNIVKQENGFLFELNDEKAFIEYVSTILDNIEAYQKMSLHNVEYVKKYSMDECAKKYLEVFKKYSK